MKFSEALRLGAMTVPQAFGNYFRRSVTSGEILSACALGTAILAVDRTDCSDIDKVGHLCDKEWPTLAKVRTQILCPAANCQRFNHFSVLEIVVHINDCHNWTREKIADWVELNFEQPEVPECVSTEKSPSSPVPVAVLAKR